MFPALQQSIVSQRSVIANKHIKTSEFIVLVSDTNLLLPVGLYCEIKSVYCPKGTKITLMSCTYKLLASIQLVVVVIIIITHLHGSVRVL